MESSWIDVEQKESEEDTSKPEPPTLPVDDVVDQMLSTEDAEDEHVVVSEDTMEKVDHFDEVLRELQKTTSSSVDDGLLLSRDSSAPEDSQMMKFILSTALGFSVGFVLAYFLYKRRQLPSKEVNTSALQVLTDEVRRLTDSVLLQEERMAKLLELVEVTQKKAIQKYVRHRVHRMNPHVTIRLL